MAMFKLKDGVPLDLISVNIKGERVALIPVSPAYASDIFKEFTAEITRYMMPKPVDDIQQVNKFIDTSRKNMIAGSELILAITKKDHGEFLGICGLHGKENSDTPELGVWIKKSVHGKKLGREAVRILASWAQDNLNFSCLHYPVDKNNIPSRKIAESLGGVVVKEGLRESMSGNVLNEVVYRINVMDNS